LIVAASALAATLLAATSKSSSGGISIFYLFLLVAVAFYFFVYRPQQKKARAMREQANTFDVGDEVLTAGGIVGHVIAIEGDRVTLETSVGASFVVLKQYVLRRLEAPVPDEPDDEDVEAPELGEASDGSDDGVPGASDHAADPTAEHGGDHAEAPEGDPDAVEGTGAVDGAPPTARRRRGSGRKRSADPGTGEFDEPTGTDGPSII
jgi:preprotein translocase subunit YajC